MAKPDKDRCNLCHHTCGNVRVSTVASQNLSLTMVHDLGIHRRFKFTERTALEFRAEAFNALNHTNLGAPNVSLSVQADPKTGRAIFNSPGFGLIASARAARFIQLVMRFEF